MRNLFLKQLKYDFIFSARLFLGLGAAMLALGVAANAMQLFGGGEFGSDEFIGLTLIAFGLISVYALSAVFVFRLYSQQLFGGAGHLMLTLPLGRGVQLVSKYLVAVFWCGFVVAMAFPMNRLANLRVGPIVRVSATGAGSVEFGAIIGSAGSLLHFVAMAFSAVAILYFVITLAHSVFRWFRFNALSAGVAGVGYFIAFWAVNARISGRHREWVTEELLVTTHGDATFSTSRTVLLPVIGAEMGRIPLGEAFVDVYFMAGLLAFGLAAAGATYWLLKKKVSLGG